MIAASTAPVLLGDGVLFDIVITLTAAVALGMLLQRLRQSVLIGYLLAGLLLGPGALGVVTDADLDTFSAMGEVGVALLLFTIGLELPWSRVQRMGRNMLVAGAVQVALTIAIATPVLVVAGLGWAAATTIAMALSLSSTAVVMRILADRAETDSVHGLAAIGILLAQDLAVVAFLLVVPQLGGAGGSGSGVDFALALALSLLKLGGLVAAMYVLELVVMRRLFRNAALGPERELLALSSIVVSLGAVGACAVLGLSPALGGFMAGVLMADAAYADQVRAEIAPIRMGLVALFFAWVGMLADVGWMAQHAPQIALAVIVIVAGKALITAGTLRAMGAAPFVAALTGVAIAQLGEFSFAIVVAGRSAGVLDDGMFQLFVSASLVTLLMSPSLIAVTSRIIHRTRATYRTAESSHAEGIGPILVIGHGPSGRTVVEALVSRGLPVTIIELNPRVREDPPAGAHVVYGDAAQPEILERADVAGARLVVVTVPEPSSLRRMVRQIRALAPEVPIIARGRYNMYLGQAFDAGATVVVDEETVTGRELAEVACRMLERGALDAAQN